MLAKLSGAPFDDPGWIYEIKWDGYRAIADLKGADTRLYSRNGLSFAETYPDIYSELQDIRKDMILDGEIVAFDADGHPAFENLQQYGHRDDVQLVYYVFDLLYVHGKSVKELPLLERKKLLKQLLPESDHIRYCDHVQEHGKEFFDLLRKKELEGMIAKRADSVYVEQARNGDWLKIKHIRTGEAVIAGYTQPRGGRSYFGALVLGVYRHGRLVYAGHTGTGFDQQTIREVYEAMQPLVTDENPFGSKVPVNMPVTWVRPRLVCQLRYTEITKGGSRRHPVFAGLRSDKSPRQVHAETAGQPVAQQVTSNGKHMKQASAPRGKAGLTNTDKVFWPEEGFTKGDVIAYYNSVYRYIIPHLRDRPQSLHRTPGGINGPSFFHKDAGGQAPDWMATFPTWSDSANKTVDYLVCNDKPSLQYLANLGCIELNPWNSRTVSPERPDYLVLDLDPSAQNTFAQVVECAQVAHEILERAGVRAYCKTSGATGLHIYVPLGARYDYEHARIFAELVARLVREQLPDTTTLERSLKKRSRKQIYLDYLQNKQGATLACAYSLRPRPGAPVSAPLDWKEVKAGLDPGSFHIKNMQRRLEKKGDLFAPVLRRGINMEKALKLLDR